MADGMPTWHQPVAKANHKLKFLNSLTRQKVSDIQQKYVRIVTDNDRMNLYRVMDEELRGIVVVLLFTMQLTWAMQGIQLFIDVGAA